MENDDIKENTITVSPVMPDFNITYTSDQSTHTIDIASLISDDDLTVSFDYGITEKEFIDTMPSLHKIQNMCEEYPALQQVFEKFVNVYNLVKDDYDSKNDNKDIPF